jgi:hypothetical protein
LTGYRRASCGLLRSAKVEVDILRGVGQSASQSAAWRADVRATGVVWTVEDDEGVPAPENADGRRAMPFWSTQSRVENIIASVPAYAGFRPRKLSLDEFRERWLGGLEQDGLLVGINWSGGSVTGYDVEPTAHMLNVALMLPPRVNVDAELTTLAHAAAAIAGALKTPALALSRTSAM